MNLEDVVPAARALLPVTSERAEKTEAARRLLPEAAHDLRDAGMFKLVQPKRFGGFELDPAAVVRASAELARGCGSTGWCLGVLSVHNWMLGLYDLQAQEDVWGEDPETLLAASFAPTGQAERVADGIRVSGRWSFASGCDASSWMMVGAVVPGEAERVSDRRQLACQRSRGNGQQGYRDRRGARSRTPLPIPHPGLRGTLTRERTLLR